MELVAPNGDNSGETDHDIEKQGWRKRFVSHLQRGKPRFMHMITSSSSNRHSDMNSGEGLDNKSRKTNNPPPTAISVNESRRKKEDNMAVIFMGFILVFLVCHLPRLLLNMHELITYQDQQRCMEAGKNPWPIWSIVMIR